MNIVPFVISIIILALAVFIKFPYGFYIFLKFIIFGTMVYSTYCCFNKKNKGLAWASIVVLIIYNPFIPLYLTREIWVVINILTVILCVVLIIWENLNTKTDAESNSKSNEEHNATPDEIKKKKEEEFRKQQEAKRKEEELTAKRKEQEEREVKRKAEEEAQKSQLSDSTIQEQKKSDNQSSDNYQDLQAHSASWQFKPMVIFLAVALLLLTFFKNRENQEIQGNISSQQKTSVNHLSLVESYNLAVDYYYGKNGKKQDYTKATEYLLEPARLGNSDAQNLLGNIYYSEKKYITAFDWYYESARQDNIYGLYNLGLFYFYGNEHINTNYKEAARLFIKSADLGLPVAQYMAGYCYYNAIGVEVNKTIAIGYYATSCKNNYAEAQYALGKIYLEGIAVEKNIPLARELLEQASSQGNQQAIDLLKTKADLLSERINIAVQQDSTHNNLNETKADDNKGNADSARKLKEIEEKTQKTLPMQSYDSIEGKEELTELEIKLISYAAKDGDSGAQYKLGLMYFIGEGVKEDRPKAIYWLTESANQNNAKAKKVLGDIEKSGIKH